VLLLDLDDTIVADAVTVEECWDVTCLSFEDRLGGIPAAKLVAEILEHSAWYWGDPERHRRGRLDLVRARTDVVVTVFERVGIESHGLAEQIAVDYSRQRDERLIPFPGAIEAIRGLRSRGLRLALLTNGAAEAQRAKIERWQLAGHFDCIAVEGELGFGKPDARVYRHALEQLAIEPRDAWMVGDNLEWDVAAPQRLGISGVWVDVRGTGLPAGAPVKPAGVIRALAELPALLDAATTSPAPRASG
jgi:putative hydrolase of the HAD superfamily